MSDWSIFLVSFVALATGWLLAKCDFSHYWSRFRERIWHRSYMRGLHWLLNEQTDHAIEDFLKESHVNAESFELHYALANMLRRKGEVDRAIRIHANLVECNRLPKKLIHIATIELAHDYISAGLLDSAERLLINVINNSSEFQERPLELLQQIYQKEKEWEKAIVVAEQLLPNRKGADIGKHSEADKYRIEIAHYYCEIAEKSLREHNFRVADEALSRALEIYPACARATLLRAELALERNNNASALAILEELPRQDPHLLVDALPLLERCFDGNRPGFISYLQKILADYPSTLISKKAFELLHQEESSGAAAFLRQQVRQRPTLQGLDLLIEQQQAALHGEARENLLLLRQLVSDILKNKAVYRCHACGFSGMHMHWLCPKCLAWDSVRRIRGGEGD